MPGKDVLFDTFNLLERNIDIAEFATAVTFNMFDHPRNVEI